MALNSVNTNMGAMVALASLNKTASSLQNVQKQISTGYRVADAKDDGAAFAVAQSTRADIAGLTSANQQMGGVTGILDTTMAALTNVSNTMATIKSTLVKLADDNLSTDERTQYATQYSSLVTQAQNFLSDATYNGKSLFSGSVGGTALTGADIATVKNESGGTYTVASTDATTLLMSATASPTAPATATAAAGLLSGTTATDFSGVMSAINTALNTYGSNSNYLSAQVSYNSAKIDAVTGGMGALVDADLAKESAKLQSLQISQQLGTQALSIANQAPQTLLSLFR